MTATTRSESGNAGELLDRYLSSPWQVVAEQCSSSSNKDWWVSIAIEFNRDKRVHVMPLVEQFKRALHSFTTRTDLWILRIIAGNHPLVALNSLPLIIARGKGRLVPKPSQAPTSTSGGSPAPSRSPSPVPDRAQSRSPVQTESRKRQKMTVIQSFEPEQTVLSGLDWLNRKEDLQDHEREYIELVDTDPESPERVKEMEQVVDLLELLRRPLLLDPTNHLQEAVAFIMYVVQKPEGKAQRQVMQRLVIRAVGLLGYWVCCDPPRTRQCISNESNSSLDLAEGAIARISYYNQGARKMQWVKQNWHDSTISDRFPPQLQVLDDAIEQVDFDEPNPNYEEVYRECCLRPTLARALETEVLTRLTRGREQYNAHLVSLVLTVAYQSPDKFRPVADALVKWRVSDSSRRVEQDPRIGVFLDAVDRIMRPD